MNLSIIIPVFNSQKILPKLIKLIVKSLKKKIKKYEIILVNDCSKDLSWITILKITKIYSFVRGINLKKNQGQHSAIFIGLKYCKGKNIICMDDDLQHNPIYLEKIYNQLERGFDICYVKYLNRQHSKFKIFISWINNITSSYLMNKSMNIYMSSFKGFTSKLKNKIIKKKPNYIFLDYLLLQNSKKISSIYVKHNKRLSGKTNYNLKELLSLWSKMVLSINVKKISIRFIIIFLLQFCILFFLKNFKNKKKLI